jgi:hypothetical protein
VRQDWIRHHGGGGGLNHDPFDVVRALMQDPGDRKLAFELTAFELAR